MPRTLRVSSFAIAMVMIHACGGPSEPADSGIDSSTATCASDDACDDGLFCNGLERCSPGSSGADARGCAEGTVPCSAGEVCSEETDACGIDCPDRDGDGQESADCGGTDCDDMDERRYAGNVEVCDRPGLDEDCDPTTLGNDADADGYVSNACCNELPTGRVECGNDCDDTLAGVSPSQTDTCGAGDQDCDGLVDENPDQTFYEDRDGDGFGVATATTRACSASPGYAVLPGDCDDTLAAVHPGGTELCNLRDDNCVDGTDEGCGCSPDGLSEGCGTTDVGACRLGTRTCVAGTWSTCSGAVDAQPEICDGAEDEDCDGTVDDGCECVNGETRLCGMSIGVCRAVLQTCSSGAWPRACTDEPGVVWPGTEECDGVLDQNCDGAVDEGCECTNGAVDRSACGTDTGECVSGMRTCSVGAWGACSGGVGPATEVCDGARDENCDGAIDEGCTCTDGTTRSCGTGACAGTQTCSGGGWGACSGAAPATTEPCNGIDDDCDGRSDALDSTIIGTSCSSDVGMCTRGTYSCPSTAPVCSGVVATAEVCDHRDQDCDGQLDDNVGVATCTWDRGSGSSSFYGSFLCSSSCPISAGRVGLADGSTSQPPVTAVLRAASALPDWGRSMSVTGYFDAGYSGGGGPWALGQIGVMISPHAMPSATSFPVMTGTERGYVALYDANPLLNRVEIWEMTSAGNYRRASSSSWPAACMLDDTTIYEYQITLSNDGGTINASLTTTRPGCSTLTTSFVDGDWQQLLYGDSETQPYPRYQIGAYAENIDWFRAWLERLVVTRTRTTARSHCVACPW